MFDGEVVVLSAPVDAAHVQTLGEREAALIARAVPKRQNEFATARTLARDALARFGVNDFEILHDGMRAPIWAEGIAGSLSHCRKRAFAAVGRRAEVGTVGIDAEDRPGLSTELWSHVLLGVERAAVESLPPDERERAALVIFSAKESLYKAQYPRSGLFMDFVDLQIDDLHMIQNEGTFRCIFQRTVGPIANRTVVLGRVRLLPEEGIVLTTVQMRDG